MDTQLKIKTRPALAIAYSALAAVSIGFFIGTALFLTRQTNEFSQSARASCSVLTEKQCRDTIIRCQPVFDGSAKFTACKALDPSQEIARKTEKEQCVQTGGDYIAERYGPYCNCAAAGKHYRAGYGCQ